MANPEIPNRGRELGARAFGLGYITILGPLIGYQGIRLIQTLVEDDPMVLKVAKIAAATLVELTAAGIEAEGITDVITGQHHFLSTHAWKRIRGKGVAE